MARGCRRLVCPGTQIGAGIDGARVGMIPPKHYRTEINFSLDDSGGRDRIVSLALAKGPPRGTRHAGNFLDPRFHTSQGAKEEHVSFGMDFQASPTDWN